MNNKISYFYGLFIIGSLLLTYLINDDFYLKYILHPVNRELQFVEILTFLPALLSSMIFFYLFFSSIKHKKPLLLILSLCTVSLAVLFFAGEEISWGQSYFGWETPESYKHKAVETNLHNTDLPIHGLANLFLLTIFFIFPYLMKKDREKLPSYMNILKPELPVIYLVLTGFIWKSCKSLFISCFEDYKTKSFYINFMEQMNEHKEMIIALSFLLLAFHTLKKYKTSLSKS